MSFTTDYFERNAIYIVSSAAGIYGPQEVAEILQSLRLKPEDFGYEWVLPTLLEGPNTEDPESYWEASMRLEEVEWQGLKGKSYWLFCLEGDWFMLPVPSDMETLSKLEPSEIYA